VLTGAGVTVGVTVHGAAAAGGSGWTSSASFTNQVASSPTTGSGYPVPPGQTFPNPSDVIADGGGPVYYQQQVLATVPRQDFGTGF
jgi:hypothetical protein